MTILVTGATGGVGRSVVDLLHKAGEPVVAASRRPQAMGAGPQSRFHGVKK